MANVAMISCLAKCRPGHILCPPPYGIHPPATPSRVNFGAVSDRFGGIEPRGVAPSVNKSFRSGPLVGSSGYTRNRSAQNWSSGCGSSGEPMFHKFGFIAAVRLDNAIILSLGKTHSPRWKSSRSGVRVTMMATRSRSVSA